MLNPDDFMIPSEMEPEWPPSDAEIQAQLESGELDPYDRQKLDDLIAEELWRDEMRSVPTPEELNPNLK